MRRHRFVKGQRCSVTRTRDHTHDPGTEGTAPASDVVGVLQSVDASIDQTRGAQTGGKNGGDDDAEHIGVALAHTVKELLGEFLRIAQRNNQSADGTDQHSLSHAHLDSGDPHIADDQNRDRNERHESLERIGREVIVLDLGFVDLSIRIALAVTHQEADHSRANHQDGAAHQRVVGMRTDEFHHIHAGHLCDERIVRGTRREI